MKIQPAVDEYERVKEELDKSQKAWDELSEASKVDESKIDNLNKNMDEVKKKRDAIVNKYYEEEDAFMVQQKLVRKIEWMTREKERAMKRDQYRREREAEEAARKPIHPYLEEMEICDQLVAYCKRFLVPKKEEEKKEIQKVDNALLNSKISKGEIVVMQDKKKKEEEGMLVIGGGKRKKKEKKEKKKTKKGEEAKFQVDIGTLAQFDRVQLQPPLNSKELATMVEKLIAKKKYFEELPLHEKKEEVKAPLAEEKKEEEKKSEAPKTEAKEEPKVAVPEPAVVPAAPAKEPVKAEI